MIGSEFTTSADQRTYRDLLHRLENARSSLAVAIAAETKRTPPELRRDYIDMEDRMRRCVKELRSRPGLAASLEWVSILQALRKLPKPPGPGASLGEARQLCSQLKAILEAIEEIAHARSRSGD